MDKVEELKNIVAVHFGALGFLNPSENEQILKDRDKVLNALTELKAIKEAKPSEALEGVDILYANALDLTTELTKYLPEYLKPIRDQIKHALQQAEGDKKKATILDGIVDYLDLRIKSEPIREVKMAFEEIIKHIDVLKGEKNE